MVAERWRLSGHWSVDGVIVVDVVWMSWMYEGKTLGVATGLYWKPVSDRNQIVHNIEPDKEIGKVETNKTISKTIVFDSCRFFELKQK